jgi:hypothetical protein
VSFPIYEVPDEPAAFMFRTKKFYPEERDCRLRVSKFVLLPTELKYMAFQRRP